MVKIYVANNIITKIKYTFRKQYVWKHNFCINNTKISGMIMGFIYAQNLDT